MHPSNEKVDKEVKEAASLPRVSSDILPSSTDLFLVIRQLIKTLWKTHWQSLASESNKLALRKNTSDSQASSNQPSRKHETILTCLRIGHTRITNTYTHTHTHRTLHFPTPSSRLFPLRQRPFADGKAYRLLRCNIS